MKNSSLLFLTLLLIALFGTRAGADTYKMIENFDRYDEGSFPTYIKTWPFQRGKAQQIYKIKREGDNKFLSGFDDKNFSTQLYREFDWRLEFYPYLKWRWRATTLPQGARENDPSKNDSACGVYVLFGKTTGTALKFTWSSTLPAGTIYEKKPGKMAIKILRTGASGLNQWHWESVNIAEAYGQLLKKDLERDPTGFGILTDGNAVQKPAGCDYDDFHISATP